MATKRMLIDATHPEETRVVVLNGNRLEEFDVEVASRKQLKGNIYLAKVTRVEPSLQAAFVEYGGNRHGFLAFNEIHPDYYQIPVADRERLVAEQKAENRDDDDENGDDENGENLETLGGEEEVEVRRPANMTRRYKIQEVIKRRQILLIQVVKEERGNKGAALTTYLSLAGRYCVLMPNTARGGGISRKIANSKDRKRLKDILKELEIPEGMAVIVRTAGAERTRVEIKRDYTYLIRLWDQVRRTTLESSAPALVYEEADLIKRSIRDLYSRDIDEIQVDGEDGWRAAKDFMKLLMPSHAKKVQLYKGEGIPLFHRYQVESQLDAMHGTDVQLRSGGYVVINPTEALVSIDVNSGKATKERNIEETALKTNLEAAEEIARQLRLRDLAGLIVIDFIDMENTRNQISVERRLKDAMKTDRARIQVGRISAFGLLELSRQRLRPSLHETTFEVCPHCHGMGVRRSIESAALYALRAIEEEGMRKRSAEIMIHLPSDVVIYMLNNKREALAAMEERWGLSARFATDDTLVRPDHRIERLKTLVVDDAGEVVEVVDEETPLAVTNGSEEEGGGKRRRRRRSRRRKRGGEDGALDAANGEEQEFEAEDGGEEGEEEQAARSEEGEGEGRRRRRGRRGGRRRNRRGENAEAAEARDEALSEETPAEDAAEEPEAETAEEAPQEAAQAEDTAEEEAPKKKATRRRRTKKAEAEETAEAGETEVEETAEAAEAEEAPKKKPTRRRRTKKAEEAEATAESEAAPAADEEAGEDAEKEAKPKRARRTRKAKAEETPDTETAEEEPKPKPKRRRTTKKAAEEAPVAETPAEEPPAEEPPAEEPPAEEPSVEEPPVEDVAAEEEKADEPEGNAKTTVIDLGAGDAEPVKKRRVGWWNRGAAS